MHEARMPSLKDEIAEKAEKDNEVRRKKVRKQRKEKREAKKEEKKKEENRGVGRNPESNKNKKNK